MDLFWQWLALGLALTAVVMAVISAVRVGRLAQRTELQLRALAQRESWQRRA